MDVRYTYFTIDAGGEEGCLLDTGTFFRYTFLVLMVSDKVFNTLGRLLYYPTWEH